MSAVAIGAAVAGAAVSGAIAKSGSHSGGGGQASQLADPFQASRPQYAAMLNQFMQDPTTYTQQQPGYQFQYQQGLDALMRQQAASGMSQSGNAMLAAEKYGQQYALGQSSNLFNELAQLSGASWQSGPSAANALLAGQQQQYAQGSALGQGMGGLISQGIQGYFGSSSGTPVDMTGFQNAGYTPSYNWSGNTSPTINIDTSPMSGAYFGGGVGDYSGM